jgi:hypothetical protein
VEVKGLIKPRISKTGFFSPPPTSQASISVALLKFFTFICLAVPMVAMASVASPRTCSASKNKTDLRPPGTAVENSAVPAAKSSGTKRTRKNAASDSEDE